MQIRDRLDDLHRRFKSEKDVRRRERLHCLYLFKRGVVSTPEEAAEVLVVSAETIRNWLSIYASGGLDDLLTLRTHSNRQPSIPSPALEVLKKKAGYA